MDAIADKLLAKLRQVAPHRVRVYDNSDETRTIAVPERRRKWAQVIESIEAKPWVRCEMLNKAGDVLGYIENAGPAEGIEELAVGMAPNQARDRWMLEMMIKAQTVALSYRDKEHAQLLQNVSGLLEVHAHATRELVQLFAVQRDVAADVAAMKAAAENGGDMDQIVKLIQASPKLMQTLAPILAPIMAKLLSTGEKKDKGKS